MKNRFVIVLVLGSASISGMGLKRAPELYYEARQLDLIKAIEDGNDRLFAHTMSTILGMVARKSIWVDQPFDFQSQDGHTPLELAQLLNREDYSRALID